VEPITTAHRILSSSVEKVPDDVSVKDVKQKPGVLKFGEICFQREVAKKHRSSEAMDSYLLGSILCEEEATPASCGVRAIWVSPSNRRKHIATHLLDAVRYFTALSGLSFTYGLLVWVYRRYDTLLVFFYFIQDKNGSY